MFNGWTENLLAGVQVINQILTAGIAITAFSLFLYSLSFNLRDRVARSFAIILLCVVVIFTTDALQSKDVPLWGIDLLLRLHWFGIIYLPAAYLHLSDAVLVTAGRPSRGRRRFAIRLTYAISTIFVLSLAAGYLLGSARTGGSTGSTSSTNFLVRGFYSLLYRRDDLGWLELCPRLSPYADAFWSPPYVVPHGGATAPALGSYPYLLYGSLFAARFPLLFWLGSASINILVGGLVVVMAYAVAFFGVSWPDRVIKSRLFKWIIRGPITASLALGLMTIVRRAGVLMGSDYSVFVPLTMVATVLLFEHAITLFYPLWERYLFFGHDRSELQILQNMEERLLTQSDLQQFLEAVLAAVRDHMQAPAAFVAALDESELSLIVMAGNRNLIEHDGLSDALERISNGNGNEREEFESGKFWMLPLHQRKRDDMDLDEIPPLLGLMGVARRDGHSSMEQ